MAGGSPSQVTRSRFFQDLKSQIDETSKQAWQKWAWERSEGAGKLMGNHQGHLPLVFQIDTGLRFISTNIPASLGY